MRSSLLTTLSKQSTNVCDDGDVATLGKLSMGKKNVDNTQDKNQSSLHIDQVKNRSTILS